MQYRTVNSVQKRPFGFILILVENFSPYALDESEVRGDFMAIKAGDLLLLRNGKYQKNHFRLCRDSGE